MATEVQNGSERSLSTLVSGIVSDVHDLVKQQLELTRREIEEDLRKTRAAALVFALGAGFCVLSGVSFCLMLAHLLHTLTGPPGGIDPAWMPLWVCHAVVGALLLIVGGSLICAGKEKLKAVHPLQNQASEALKENVQWMTTPK